MRLPTGTVLAGDALAEAFFPLHSAAGPLFADDADATRRNILAITDAAHGDVRVAHYGRLEERSLARLARRLRSFETGPELDDDGHGTKVAPISATCC